MLHCRDIRLVCNGYYPEIHVVHPASLEILFSLSSRIQPDWISALCILRPVKREGQYRMKVSDGPWGISSGVPFQYEECFSRFKDSHHKDKAVFKMGIPTLGWWNLYIETASWWQLVGLLSWYPVFESVHCNSFESHGVTDLPMDIGLTWQWCYGTRSRASNGCWVTCPFTFVSLTHWGRVTHICVSKLSILGSDNGLAPTRRQAII